MKILSGILAILWLWAYLFGYQPASDSLDFAFIYIALYVLFERTERSKK